MIDLPPKEILDGESAAVWLARSAASAGISDIHIDPVLGGVLVRGRHDGELRELIGLTTDQGTAVINQIKVAVGMLPGDARSPANARWVFDEDNGESGGRCVFRVTIVPCIGGDKVALRLITRQQAISLGDIGLSPAQHQALEQWSEIPRGLVFLGGATGTGKTTTLYALVNTLVDAGRMIITAEDPVEFSLTGVCQIPVGNDVDLTFHEVIPSMLRLDPDVLIVGEVRDAETAAATMRAAVSGHTILTSVHARDVAGIPSAMRALGATSHQIAATVTVFLSQRLVPRICPSCRKAVEPKPSERASLAALGIKCPEEIFRGVGCGECRDGRAGRIAVFESWFPGEEGFSLLLEGADEKTLRREISSTKSPGDVSFDTRAAELLAEGEISASSAIAAFSDLSGRTR